MSFNLYLRKPIGLEGDPSIYMELQITGHVARLQDKPQNELILQLNQRKQRK